MKRCLQEGKNHRQSSYDATTLGGGVFESWAEGTRTPGNEIPWMRRIWESLGTLHPQIKAWQMTQQRDQHPSCPLTKPFTQMFCIWRFWGFYEKSNELSWSARRCQRLETRMFSTSSFPPLEDRKLEAGRASPRAGERDFMFKCNSMFLKILKGARE